MPRFLFLILFFLPIDTTNVVDLDSVYSESSLNKILQKARKERDHTTLANVYFKLGEFEEKVLVNPERAFEYYTRSVDYYKIIKDTMQLNLVKERIASRYVESGSYEEALQLYKELREYYKGEGNLYMQTKLTGLLSDIYNLKGDVENEFNYINAAKRLNNTLRDTSFMIDNMLRTVKYYQFLNEPDTALAIALRSLSTSLIADDRKYTSRSLFHVGNLYKEKSNFLNAEKYLQRSLEHESSKLYNEDKLNTYRDLAYCYERLGDFKRAYLFSTRYEMLKDSIMNHERVIAESNIIIKYKTEAKEKEIQNLEKENEEAIIKSKQQKRALTILTTGLALLVLALYYIIRFYTQRIKASRIINQQKTQISEQKIRELEDNLKISSMQSMIEGQELERERIAKDLHDSLGGLLSTIKLQFDNVQSKVKSLKNVKEYKNANKLIDTAVEEVRTISRNLQPGAMKDLGLIASLKDLFNRVEGTNNPEVTFQYFDFPHHMDNILAMSIYRIIQELLNNAIKHSKAGEILVQLTREDDELVILFEDDGVGFDETNLKRKGMGLENIKSRVNYLKGSLHIDSRLGEGTSFLIHIKHTKKIEENENAE